jgi:hypothetical protein
LYQASAYISGIREALGVGDNDVQVVVVLRHAAIPLAFNDAMWAKYKIGEVRKIKDGETWATRNPFLNSKRADAHPNRPAGTLSWLASHGHIFLGCDIATQGLASTFARAAGTEQRAVYEELRANLVPGVTLQPNGIYAVHRAQEAGCTYFKSS